MKEIVVMIGQRGGGQILGVFSDKKLVRNLKSKVKKYHQEGYVVFEKLKVNEPQVKRFGLYFK